MEPATDTTPIPRWRETIDARGRANRTEFLTVTALGWAAFVVCGLLVQNMPDAMAPAAGWLIIAAVVAVPAVGIIMTIRRLHDWGRSGWWSLLVLAIDLPLAGMSEPTWFSESVVMIGILLQAVYALAYLVIFSAVPGQRGPNRFGPRPGANTVAEAFD